MPAAKKGNGRRKRSGEHVLAAYAFATEHQGREVIVTEGMRLDASHPLVKAHPDAFVSDQPEPDLD